MVMMMKKAAVGLMFASLAHVGQGFSSQSAHSTKHLRGEALNSMPPPSGNSAAGGAEMNPYLDRHASEYIEDLRNKRSDDSNGRSFSANNPPGGWDMPNAGSTASQPRARGVDPNVRGLGALASGVSTPMDKYNYDGPRSRPMPREPRRPPGPNSRFNEIPDSRFGDAFGPMETVSALGSSADLNEIRALQDEVERLRKENAMLKRSCGDLLNNFNELSNRLFDVDESLKKVAKVFPSEDEMESLEWLMKK